MKTLLIDGFGNITKEGLTIHFNQKFSLHEYAVDGKGGLETDEWYVSWDKIGKALCGDKYCEETEVAKLRELRKVNPVDAQVILQKGGSKHEIMLDSETSIRVGYDECEINDGVAPNKVLASGIIEGQEFNTLSYVVINLI